MIEPSFWQGKKVIVTGHTGFKGAWLCLWLHELGADVTGYALPPPTEPSLYELCGIGRLVKTVAGDVRDRRSLCDAMLAADPDIVIHMAAQSLVRKSYLHPVETYETNVMGTLSLLEAIRRSTEERKRIKAVVNVTTDKCYENREWPWGYRENEPLGGFDPYSNSKACSELVTSCYRDSFFNARAYDSHGVALASARAGNVIGGGDWAEDRLVPDCIRSLLAGQTIRIRNPDAVRPWQHVLEPLGGYLLLAQKLYESGPAFADSWNFGPDDMDSQPVSRLVSGLCRRWGPEASYEIVAADTNRHEAYFLKLDCSKARFRLGWKPVWGLAAALDKVIEWTHAYRDSQDVREVCLKHIREYMTDQAGCEP